MKKFLKKLALYMLAIIILIPNFKAFASSDEFGKGDGWYQDGMYLLPISAIADTRGEQENPYYKNKREIVSEKEAKLILKNKNLQLLVEAYNSLYQNVITLYKFGYNHMDLWIKVKNMEDPVFGKINKKTWVDTYEEAVELLHKIRCYFYSIGIVDKMYTYEKTLNMANMEDIKFPEIEFVSY
ncbi:MAG: hypothetical protein PUG67_02805 [Peptoniphilaceae bacterium]|nr:hypothetical protein [Peptoniphilaceae bacterium]MDY6019495.1 hypothetical protein [Anaerococcus sp.]